jgi:hypothetical protein
MSDFFICPDCEQATATQPDSLCATCQQWRDQRLDEMDSEYQDRLARQVRRRMKPSERFGEACADMVKAVDQSRRHS